MTSLMSSPLILAYQWAKTYDHGLRADDPRFRKTVRLVMEDKSAFTFDSAFVVTRKKEVDFYYVFTEHYGYHLYAKDDVEQITEYTQEYPIQLLDE